MAQGFRIEDQSYKEYMSRRSFHETDAPEHTDIRRFVNPNFTKPVVAKFDTLIRELTVSIIKKAL